MPVLTSYLKIESELIRTGIAVLDAFCKQLEAGKAVSIEDLRVALYAMQISYESSILVKKETLLYLILFCQERQTVLPPSLLTTTMRACEHNYDLGKESLLHLRLGIDSYERKPEQKGLLGWRVGLFMSHVSNHVEVEEPAILQIVDDVLISSERKRIFSEVLMRDHSRRHEHLQGPKLIFGSLMRVMGMTAA